MFRRIAILCGLAMVLQTVPAAWAGPTWPQRPVTWVVGYAAGGTTDIIARTLAHELSEQTGQTFVVENRTGANSNIGAEIVKRAEPDGYTFYVGSTANAINRTLYKQLNYDIVQDFASVAMLGTVPNLLVVNPSLPIKSVKDYIEYAKANPGKLTCASSGTGSAIHMSCELFKLQTGTNILHVPYRGSGPAMTDLLGGQVDSIFDNMPTVLPNVQAGKLRALGVTTSERSPSAPDIPTLAESGLPDFSVQSWFGLFAPAATDPAIVQQMNVAVNKALASDAVRKVFDQRGVVKPKAPNATPEFAQFVQGEVDRWAKVVKQSGAKVE
ncbi:Bug family tripartite tricarboxylate transporter substrate binding protein [Bordetella petrii]|uniref:Secreted protein n=1 Tax=Bordetella petrii (strain ATCC BAA-461 / DSM 12804 / CCUG 43448 / CIP 107267 / Se-1111R) TaxID=340100 RepID=A9IDE1_BORPD|nr:putative secreted protein [Bordetella petrii]